MSEDVSNAVVLQAVTNLAMKVEAYHGDFREFRGEAKTQIVGLESSVKDAKLWSNVKLFCVLPVAGALHQIAQHFGWIK